MTKLFNKEKARMEYLRTLQIHILDALYKEAEASLEKIMWQIAEENQTLVKGNSPTFFFGGRWWPVVRPNNPADCNRILDASLYDKVEEIINNHNLQDRGLRSGIETMVGNFLTAAGHTDDLARLLPDAIQATMPAVDADVFNVAKPLPDHEIEDLLAINEDNIKYLKRLLMTQLLLSKAA